MTAQRAAPEASSMPLDQMTALQSASGQISLAPVVQLTTARKKRAGQTDLPIATVIQNHVVLIQEASVSPLLVLTVLGNLVHLELIAHLLTVLTRTETPPTVAQEATTEQTAPTEQHDQTQTVLGNLVHLELIAHLLTVLTQTEELAEEATTAQTAPTDQHDRTQIVLGNLVLQDQIVQSAQVSLVDSHLVQTHASMTETATRSARTAFPETVQEMTALLALATRTQTRRHFSRTRF
jgi:hypothetical protein